MGGSIGNHFVCVSGKNSLFNRYRDSYRNKFRFFFTFQWIGGFVTFLFPQLKAAQKEKILPYHLFFGMTGFVLAIAAALLGLCEKAVLYVDIFGFLSSSNVQ